MQLRISKAFPEILGVSSYLEQKESTNHLTALQTSILAMVAEFKVQIKVDYKSSEAELLLNRLGIGKTIPFTLENKKPLLPQCMSF